MNRDQFLKELQAEFQVCWEISNKKNRDYAEHEDPFANFRTSEVLGLDSSQVILLRILEKVKRVSNIMKNGGITNVQDESTSDTLRDIANYSIICLIKDREERKDAFKKAAAPAYQYQGSSRVLNDGYESGGRGVPTL